MEYREIVTSGIKQPAFEHNGQHIYIRWDYTSSVVPATDTEPEHTLWKYKEYFMPESEYYAICASVYPGPWDETLREIEREHLYDHADKMVMKYSTDVPDDTMRQKWVQYKAGVRATQTATGYPQTVAYPEMPE